MTYKLIDIDGNEHDVTLPDFRRKEDDLKIDTEIIERSSKAGAVQVGEQRDQSKELTFEYDWHDDDNDDFTEAMNELIYWLRKTVIIRNIDLNRETDVVLSGHNFSYSEGGFLRCSKNELTFKQLTPYWRDVNYITITEDSGGSPVIVNNTGWIETPPIFTITALTNTTKFSIKDVESKKGIVIYDQDFSLNGLMTYIIDCKTGTAELETLKRNNRIRKGTGFFNLIPGVNTLEISSNGSISVEIKYKRRFYL